MDKPKIRLIRDQILIKPKKKGVKKVGSIILKENEMKQSQTGVVIAKGPGHTTQQGDVFSTDEISVGDLVVFEPKYARKVFLPEDETEYVVSLSIHIYAKLEED